MAQLLSVADALERILARATPTETEMVSLGQAQGCVLADDLKALRTQPPFPASAMDGYAVTAFDLGKPPTKLTVIGEAAAGHAFNGKVGPGEAVRIFTGAPVPDGADAIAIQENVTRDGNDILVEETVGPGTYVREAGLDFHEGDVLLRAGAKLDDGALTLAAAMNHPRLPVFRKPRVAIISTGDELVMPGAEPADDQIICSNNVGVAALARSAGADVTDLGIALDTVEALSEKFSQSGCAEADIVITLGGASVGDHDLVRDALSGRQVKLDFWKLAMRPGKPVMFGVGDKRADGKGPVLFIGLPGNPVSSLVCTRIFVVPLLLKMQGLDPALQTREVILGADIPPNDEREEYMRGTLSFANGTEQAIAMETQDSSIISNYSNANCLIIRPANSPAMMAGDKVRIVDL